ncbi:hypothetical protein K2173_010529 [Erythroxylum novogranatense]|uniref:Uncharacterized protein n=1 Tax=Erythroxylum novogranatense TaxID=1862640 RepID=A0AAV8TFN9_9ROSI|nr:hypothetical protein K2173_010529 [Erythroxylum novogranatense]
MHSRHRNTGNGYRSTSMGMAWMASRTSTDTSARSAHGFNTSDYRSFNNRSFGCGQTPAKSFQQPPVCKGDILVEAGRLATEYLVSKGLLPPSVLSHKWQNGSFKKQVGDCQDFRQQDDIQEARTSVHARLGIISSPAGCSKRRYSDEFNSRNHLKGRRRGDYYRSSSSEWGKEYGKSRSWSDRNRVSPDMDGEDDSVGHFEEHEVGKAAGDVMRKSDLSGASESEEPGNRELGLQKYNCSGEIGPKAISSGRCKDDMKAEPSKRSDIFTKVNLENGELMSNDECSHENKEEIVPDLRVEHSDVENNPSSKNGFDLLALCKFDNLPTKTRSALACRALKADQVPNKDDGNASDFVDCKVPDVLVQNDSLDDSNADVLTNANDDSKSLHSEVVPIQSAGIVDEPHATYGVTQEKSVRSPSFPDRAFMHDYERESDFGMSNSFRERGEKRAAEDSHADEPTKKSRAWLPVLVTEDEEHLLISDLTENRSSSMKVGTSQGHPLTPALTQDSLVHSCQLPKANGESCTQFAQEKQFFPNLFKICDLNLMESSYGDDNHCNDQVPMYPSLEITKSDAASVDIGLSISNSNISSKYSRCQANGMEIEVIDLENESPIENKTFNSTQRKIETAFAITDWFPGHSENAGDISGVQENYDGLMISEFLTTFSNCTSVSEDITPLQNEMSLHNAEGNFGDDDSIYMSLREIPLSFIPAWERPTPKEYLKPF